MTNSDGGGDHSSRLGVSLYLLQGSAVAAARSALESASHTVVPLTTTYPGGIFFVLPASPESPKWLDAISPLLGQAVPQILGQSPGAVIWLPRHGKTFLFSFGYAHSKIMSEWVEPEFGKIVTLAVVPPGQLREIKSEQVFAKRHISSERAPTASGMREFNFERDRDLVAAVEGVPAPRYTAVFGKKIRGGTSLKFDVNLGDLLGSLDHVAERYGSGDHRKNWPEANNLIVVRDTTLQTQLDALLDGVLSGKSVESQVFLSAPAKRTNDQIYPTHFLVGRMGKAPATAPYLTLAGWKSYLKAQNLTIGVASASITPVHLLDDDKTEIGVTNMRHCLGAQVKHKKIEYVLSSGDWYSAEMQFIQSTKEVVSALERRVPSITLAAWDSKCHEGDYNIAASAKDPDLWLFDKQLVSYGVGKSRFEFCDLMHLPSKTLYFVKHPAGSSGVSHLSEQVRRTAEAFFSSDGTIRATLAGNITRMGNGWTTDWLAQMPRRHEWNLCLVLMGKKASKLPFFAQCGVSRLFHELEHSGYNVCFQKV